MAVLPATVPKPCTPVFFFFGWMDISDGQCYDWSNIRLCLEPCFLMSLEKLVVESLLLLLLLTVTMDVKVDVDVKMDVAVDVDAKVDEDVDVDVDVDVKVDVNAKVDADVKVDV